MPRIACICFATYGFLLLAHTTNMIAIMGDKKLKSPAL